MDDADPLFHLPHSPIRNPRVGKWQLIPLYKMCICSTKEQVERQISFQPALPTPKVRGPGHVLVRLLSSTHGITREQTGHLLPLTRAMTRAGQQDAQPHGGEARHSRGLGAGWESFSYRRSHLTEP